MRPMSRPTRRTGLSDSIMLLRVVLGTVAFLFFTMVPARAQDLQDVSPEQNSVEAPATIVPTATFDSDPGQPDVQVYGSRNGKYSGSPSYSGQTVSFEPVCPFLPGETVTITVSGGTLSSPFVWQFTVRSEQGNGEFEVRDPVELMGNQPGSVAKSSSVVIPSSPYAGDFDKDGFGDVAVVNQEQGEVVILQRIALDEPPTRIPVSGATTLAGGDITGSPLPDLIAISSYDNTLTIIENQGGNFSISETINTGARPLDAVVKDVNGDGNQDLAVPAFGVDRVFIHLNDGNGSFLDPVEINVSAAPSSIDARDMDRDGDLDFVVASAGEQRVDLLRNEGEGQFVLASSFDLGFTPAALLTNDVVGDGGADGWIDLVISAQNGSSTYIYQSDTEPDSFTFSLVSPTLEDPVSALGATLADFDAGIEGGSDLDLARVNTATGQLRIALNERNIRFQPPESVSSVYAVGPEPSGVAALDFDGNGSQDLAVFDRKGTVLRLLRNRGGEGIDPPLGLPGEIAFGDVCVGASETRPLDIRSNEDQPLEVDYANSLLGGVFEVSPDSPLNLVPNGSGALTVVFTPTDTTRYETDLGLITSQDSGSGQCVRGVSDVRQLVDLTGRGTAPDLVASPDTIDFGEVLVEQSESESTTLSNIGTGPAQDLQFEIQGDSEVFSVGGAPSSLSASASRSASVTFSPTSAGTFSANILFVANAETPDCAQDTVLVHVTGETGPPTPDLVADEIVAIEGQPSSINVSQSLEVVCTLSNQGNTGTSDFLVEIARNGTTQATLPYASLNVGESVTTDPVEVDFPQRGSAEVTCTVDANEQVEERDETNNTVALDVNVQVADQLEVSPNPFTPNNDGFNDAVRFRTSEFGLSQPVLKVFSFEGYLIRTVDETRSGELRWDGLDDSDQEQPPGVYMYVVQEGGQTVASGHVTLAR